MGNIPRSIPLSSLWISNNQEQRALFSVVNGGCFFVCPEISVYNEKTSSSYVPCSCVILVVFQAHICLSLSLSSVVLNISGDWYCVASIGFIISFSLLEPRGCTRRASCQCFMRHILLLAVCANEQHFLLFTCVDRGVHIGLDTMWHNYQFLQNL